MMDPCSRLESLKSTRTPEMASSASISMRLTSLLAIATLSVTAWYGWMHHLVFNKNQGQQHQLVKRIEFLERLTTERSEEIAQLHSVLNRHLELQDSIRFYPLKDRVHPANSSRYVFMSHETADLQHGSPESSTSRIRSTPSFSASSGTTRGMAPGTCMRSLQQELFLQEACSYQVPRHRRQPEDLYLIQYTSGATGEPKPAMISAGAAAHNARAARRSYDLSPSSVIVSWLPQYHDCGLMFLLLTVTSGSTCSLASPFSFAARPRLWTEMLSLFRATCTMVPGFALPLPVTKKLQGRESFTKVDLSYLQSLILINEPILASDVNSFRSSFSEDGLRKDCIAPSYGLAENCTFVCTAWKEGTGYSELPVHQGLLPSGRRASPDEMDVRVVDP